jgi:hypothetical protein
MPSRFTIQQWERTDIDGFASKFARAREEGAHVLASSVIDIADEECPSELDAGRAAAWEQQRKSRIDARKWFVSKILPKVYGDRVSVDHQGSVRLEAMTNDQLAQIASRRGIVIDVEPESDGFEGEIGDIRAISVHERLDNPENG